MRKHIENAINHVKTKSPRTRDQVAFGVALIVVVLLFGLWAALFSRHIRQTDTTGMSALGRSLSNLGSTISGAFSKVRSGEVYDVGGMNSDKKPDGGAAIPVTPGQSDTQANPSSNSSETVKPLTENQ